MSIGLKITGDIEAEGLLVKGIEGFFLTPRGSFGTGSGWSDEGFIVLYPALLFASNATERAIYMFFGIARGFFDAIDPIVKFAIMSTTAPSAAEAVRWQLTCKYRAEGESLAGAADQVLLQTKVLTDLVADTRQSNLEFTLDRTLIANGDTMQLNLERIGGDGADTYGSDIGVGQSGILLETQPFN